jgi:hypothetical protein
MRHLLVFLLLLASFTGFAQSQRIGLDLTGTVPTGTTKKLVLTKTGTTPTGAAIRFTLPDGSLTDGSFAYSVPVGYRSSAGIFTADSTLIRTLWSGVVSVSSSPLTYTWDGLDDAGGVVPAGSYFARVLVNNVQYSYEGAIGNTSVTSGSKTGIHKGYQFIRGMVEVGNYIYFCQHYAEGPPSPAKFLKSAPQVKIEYLPTGTNQATEYICSDGTNVYYGGYDLFSPGGNGKNTWVFATRVSDDSRVTFSSGTSYTPGQGTYANSAIDLQTTNNYITGLAVQTTGNYLFVSHNTSGTIAVLNKTTGALVRTITLSGVRQIAMDTDNFLWVISGTNTVAKFPVNSDGTLGTVAVTLSGLVAPLAVTVNGSTVVVCDAGTAQQVKGFSNATGAASWTLGQSGGYSTTPIVSNDRFYFSDLSGGINDSFIAYQSDGSFWVGDRGNYRVQHFNSSRAYIDNIAYIPASYVSGLDANNPVRLFDQYLEFAIDYTKTLSPTNGSWTLVRNWRNQIPAQYFRLDNLIQNVDIFGALTNVATLSNSRTYGLLRRYDTGALSVVELPASGQLRFTGISLSAPVYMGKDGGLYRTVSSLGATPPGYSWTKQSLTGFDGSNNPTWGTATGIASTTLAASDPIDWSGYGSESAGKLTSSSLLPILQQNMVANGHGYGFHLGAIKLGATRWKWRTAYATSGPSYQGEYPSDGSYDIGNHANFVAGNQNGYAGGDVAVAGKHIFWNYFGEFWKDSQTNKWQHVYDNGLLVGVFGPTGRDTDQTGMAGGVHFGHAVIDPTNSDVAYIYHAEEGGYSGLDRWKITGLNSIAETQTLSLVASTKAFRQVTTTATDLLSGLPRLSTLPASTTIAGWYRTSTEDLTAEFSGNVRSIRTSIQNYNRFASPDLFVKFSKNNETEYVYRSLGANNSTSWELSGVVNNTFGNGNDLEFGSAGSGGIYLDVLDNSGKVIARYYNKTRFDVSPAQTYWYANTTLLTQQQTFTAPANALIANQPISIKVMSGVLSLKFGSYTTPSLTVFEAGANLATPTTLRITVWDNGQKRDRAIDMQQLQFTAN